MTEQDLHARAEQFLKARGYVVIVDHVVPEMADFAREIRDEALRENASFCASDALAIEACAEFLKDGETPAECIERNRKDIDSLMTVLAQRTEERDSARAFVERWADSRGITPEHRAVCKLLTEAKADLAALRARYDAVVAERDTILKEAETPCALIELSSRICERGTRSCVVHHDRVRDLFTRISKAEHERDRLLPLAKAQALTRHLSMSDHGNLFETCPHPDCALVQSFVAVREHPCPPTS